MTHNDDSALFHMRDGYDPQKARDYYLRTRKLKGRRKASAVSPSTNANVAERLGTKRPGAAKPAPKGKPKLSAAGKRRLRAKAEARVDALEARLDKLRDVLDQLVEAAKARSGVDPKEDKAKADKNTAEKDRKPQTAAEKREAAKKAKDKYEEENAGPSAKAKALESKIADVQEKIKKAQADLAQAGVEARARKKSKTKSKTD